MPSPSEVRQYAAHFEFRDADTDGRSMFGLVAPYDSVDDIGAFTETIRAGTFAKSIREAARALPLHQFHDHTQVPVGKAVEWRDEPDGLYAEFLFDTRPEAREAARLAKEDILSGLSVGFMPIRTDWNAEGPMGKPHADRQEARLLEVSQVSVPGLAKARVLAVRSAGMPDIPETRINQTPRLDAAMEWLNTIRRTT